jgi:hypothetical protein
LGKVLSRAQRTQVPLLRFDALRAAKRKLFSKQSKEGFGDIVPKRVRAAARL